MAQGIPENLSGEQLPIPDPIRYETHSLLGDAQETITTTQCSADLYNESTINFEQGREECKQESCEARAELMHDIGITGRLQNRGRELLLRMQYGRELIDNGYTETHLLGYNNIDGNYAIEVQDFENILQGTPPEDWNSLALVNYFKLLDAGDNFSIGNLINKLGASQIIALGELWKTQPNGPAMRYFQENSELSWILGENGVSRIDFATYIDEGNIGDITNILRLIDHSSEQQSETQQVIFYALFDLFNTIDFDEPQEGKLQTLNQLSNLSGDDSSMIQYLKNTARTMVVAVDLIRNTYNEYSKVEQYGDPKPDIYVLEALIKTILQGTIIEEDSEETLEHWLGSLNEIIIHHNTEHNTIYPTFDDSLIENFLHVRFATEDTRKLSDLQIRIERIDGEMDGLLEAGMGTSERYRVLSIEKSHLQRTISNLNARYESRVSDIQASVNLFAEGRELSAGDIRYILENPLARISRVKNTAQLLDIFRNPQVDLTHLKLENINPFARRNPEIIIHFPGLLNFSSPGLLEPQVLANKDVLEKFLSSRVYFIGPIIQKMSGIQGTNIEDMFYSSLEELSQDYPIPSMYRNSLLRDDEFNINYSEDEARRYETSNSTYSESEAIQDLETLTVNSSEEIITKIQNFIRFRRPNSDLFKDTILNLVNRDVELYKIVLGPRERLRINYQDADLIALLESPEYFLQLPLNLRGDSGYIDALIDGINNTDSGEIGEKIYLLSEINFSSWSVVVQVFKRIGSSELMREIQANVDGNTLNGFITNALYAFDMLSPDRQFAAMQQDDEVEIINMLQGFQELQGDIEKIRVKNRNIADIAEEVNIDFTYPATLSFINNSFDSDTDRAEIMSIFREHNGNDVQFSNKFMEFLLSKNLGRFEVEALFEGILEAQEEDLANLQDNIVFDNEETLGEEYTGLLERGEDGETRISDEFGEIWHQFREERGEELTEMTDNEIIELFFESRNISPDDNNAQAIREYLNIDRSRARLRQTRENIPEYIAAVESGNTESFWREIDRQYNRGEISSNFTSGENIRNNQNTPLPENFSSQNPEFRTFQRQIGAEMGLARYESETLSPQEIQILGNSETARERFLDLREKLKEAKMEKIFLHRNSIMQVIGNVHGIAFTLGENDYLSDAEMMRFIGETVYATLGEEAQHLRQTYSTTDEMIEQVISLNNESSSGGIFNVNQEDVNLFGDSHIEAQFINKFAPRGQLYFNLFAFEEAIRN